MRWHFTRAPLYRIEDGKFELIINLKAAKAIGLAVPVLHLLEPTHNERFMALMDQCMPKWQSHRDALNRLPVRHESWDY